MTVIAQKIKYFINCLVELLYPEFCVACNNKLVNQEKVLCTKCLYQMPYTNYHNIPGNKVEQIFWGRVQIENATSLFTFIKKSRYQKLIHNLKYKGRHDVGIELGRILGAQLVLSKGFKFIDYIVPVPLHPKKERKRGYNQSYMIAQGISESMHVPVNTRILKRAVYTQTQTKKTRFERWENTAEVFAVENAQQIECKHILLVDDILTTGATIEGCATVLQKAANVKISVATLGYAGLS